MGERELPAFRRLVFSGGGTRCFWQGGFMDVAREPLGMAPDRIGAVSGGVLSACCYVAGAGPRLLEVMGRAFDRWEDNVDLTDDHPGIGLTPHQQIYRNVVEEVVTDEVRDALAAGPPLEVRLACTPGNAAVRRVAPFYLALYELDLKVRSSPDIRWPQAVGMTCHTCDAREAAREGDLADLICCAAAIPPIFDAPRWRGRQVMDAGVCGHAPIPEGRGPALVLLTRNYRRLPRREGVVYVSPSGETPADKLDFTDRDKIERTWDMGRRDGEAFLRRHGLL